MASPVAFAQSLNVVDVKVEGNKAASPSIILSVAGIKKGEQLTSTTTQEALKRLYGLGFFKDVEFDAEEVTGGIILNIKVQELPQLAGLEFNGNKAIKSKNLEEKLNLKVGGYLSSGVIFEKKNAISNLYAEKGYYLARVVDELKYSGDSSQVYLSYKIEEGSKVKVAGVVLTGNVRVLSKDIIGKMKNRKKGFLRSSTFDKDKYPEDKDKIAEDLHKQGYLDAYLKSDSLAIDSAANMVTIYLDIYEGPRYYFGKTDWKGNEVFDKKALSSVLKYREGQVFDLDKFDKSTYEIYFLYQEKGYLHVRAVDDRKTRDSLIDVTFDIVEGLPSKVNLVKITGNTKTKEKVIRREISMSPGQVFHRSLLIRSVRDIMQLNYFANVTPDISDLPSGDVDLLIKVDEKPTGQISAGGGYSGQDKFVGTISLGIPNFRGMGQSLSFNIDIGSRLNSYTISFTEPWMFSTPTPVGVDLYYTNRRWYDDYTEGRRGGSMRIGRRLKWPDNYFRVYARYRLEGDRFYDFSDVYNQAYRKIDSIRYYIRADSSRKYENHYGKFLPGSLRDYGEKWFSASGLELSIVRDSRNLPEFATSGSVLSYTFENTGDWLGGYWQYQRHKIEVSKFIPIFWKVALAGKLTYGFITSPAGDNRILESDRFSPGGTQYEGVVRGYDDASLTPDSITSKIIKYNRYADSNLTILDTTYCDTSYSYNKIRGKYMLVGNFELQIPVIENQLYTLLFFDLGNSWMRRNDIKFKDLYKGVGIGFRLVVPGIGTLGFDFGYPLDEKRGQKKSWHPHFQAGTIFR